MYILMRKYLFFIALWLVLSIANAQNVLPDDRKIRYTDASQLTLIGKIAPTSNRYHRVDTARYPALSEKERGRLILPSGLALVFQTNSPELWIIARYVASSGGFDLYIRSGQEWRYAFSGSASKSGEPFRYIADMDT
jgi:hypothetical protein